MKRGPFVLDAPTLEDLELVRGWRNGSMIGLRTPFQLTPLQQQNFYRDVISGSQTRDRYWAVRNHSQRRLGALVGLTGIQWENGLAEISVIADPTVPKQGFGSAAVTLVLGEAFGQMRLETVIGECYECNPAIGFWQKLLPLYGADTLRLPRRKFWNGRLWDSLYFTITREGYARCANANDSQRP